MTTIKILEGVKNLIKYPQKAFTLVELLVVIAVVAILAAVVVLIINPIELTKRARDSVRLGDLASLQSAMTFAVSESTASGVVAVLCKNTNYPCSGSSNTSARGSDGSGWVKVDLSSQKNASLATLPIDPINNTTYHYTYCANNDAWEIDTVLESDHEKSKMTGDGGNDPNTYEIGSNLQLIAPSGGSCAY